MLALYWKHSFTNICGVHLEEENSENKKTRHRNQFKWSRAFGINTVLEITYIQQNRHHHHTNATASIKYRHFSECYRQTFEPEVFETTIKYRNKLDIKCKLIKTTRQIKDKEQSLKVFWKKGIPENLAKSTGKLLCRSLFFNKAFSALFKKRLRSVSFFAWFCKFVKNTLL